MTSRTASILALAFGCAAAAPGAEPLPANSWVAAPGTEEFRKLADFRAMLSGDARPKGSDWMFVDKGPVKSASAQGVWVPDRKVAIFVVNNHYSSPQNNTFAYDPASGEKLAKVVWGAASGWKNLKAGGDTIAGTMIWASMCYDPVNKEVLLCGGNSADAWGSPGTMTYSLEQNVWKRLDFSGLPLAKASSGCEELRDAAHRLEGRLRSRWHLGETAEETKVDLGKAAAELRARVAEFAKGLPAGADEKDEVAWARPELDAAGAALGAVGAKADLASIAKAAEAAERLRSARDRLAAEPPPRANSAMACDAKAGKIVLYGGDHLDYLLSDTWVYDCKTRRWKQARPKLAPAPRAGHAMLCLPKSGKLVMLGGYAYNSEEWPRPLYVTRPLELWSFDVAASAWNFVASWPLAKNGKGKDGGDVPVSPAPAQPQNGVIEVVVGGDDVLLCGGRVCRVDASASSAGAAEAGVAPGTVAYRGGQYLPAWQDQVPPPDAAASEKFLKALPANTWVSLKPPRIFRDHRDWGTATFDTDRGQVLWFSGGHCCYSGTDVSVYSTRAGTWRMSAHPEMPVEFIAGTGYHSQRWSFSERPFMTSHTYKLYAYDPKLGKMLLYNRGDTYLFDPASCDWERPVIATPFGGGVWVPKFCTTPDGVLVWAPLKTGGRDRGGLLWRFDHQKRAWAQVQTSGGPLPGTPSDDFGTLVYDAKRKQALMFTAWGRGKTQGQLWSCDLASGALKKLEPGNAEGGPSFSRESVYLPGADLVLFADVRAGGVTVYDVAGNRFRTAALPGWMEKHNPSVGLMYDPGRDLVWGVGAFWDLHVLRFDAKSAKFSDGGK